MYTTTETHARSILKGVSWRITATLTTTLIAYILIGDVSSALAIGFFEFIAKLGLYYGHERLWIIIPWGKRWIKKDPYTIGPIPQSQDLKSTV